MSTTAKIALAIVAAAGAVALAWYLWTKRESDIYTRIDSEDGSFTYS